MPQNPRGEHRSPSQSACHRRSCGWQCWWRLDMLWLSTAPSWSISVTFIHSTFLINFCDIYPQHLPDQFLWHLSTAPSWSISVTFIHSTFLINFCDIYPQHLPDQFLWQGNLYMMLLITCCGNFQHVTRQLMSLWWENLYMLMLIREGYMYALVTGRPGHIHWQWTTTPFSVTVEHHFCSPLVETMYLVFT